MAEIPESLARFVARDLVFMVGGASVLASFLCWLDRLPDAGTPTAYYLLAAGISYAIGFTTQELFSIIGVVKTQRVYSPNRILVALFNHYNLETWKSSDLKKAINANRAMRHDIQDPQWWSSHQRYISHMMIGATLAPCAFLSSILLFLASYPVNTPWHTDLRAMAIAAAALAAIMWPLGWLKAMQVSMRETERFEASLPGSAKSSDNGHTAGEGPG